MPAEGTPEAILRQLQAPDPVGRDLALLRTRLYRFSHDRRHYVLIEALEERLLAGHPPRPFTLAYVRESLAAIRTTGLPLDFSGEVAAAENIDVTAELAARTSYTWQRVPRTAAPAAVVMIVGAPRSGTSHLFNLLASAGPFGYFTTASCWAWPVRNLHHPRRHLFTRASGAVLSVDNKRTRVIPGLVMPGEAEDIWARAIPVYRHIAGHRYEITPPQPGQVEILNAAASAHLDYFGRAMLLAKTPFNSFRIQQIERLWGAAVRYLHIVRDVRETASSMRRNRFEFSVGGHLLGAEDAWSMFVNAVRDNAPADRTITVTHRELLANPHRTLARILGTLRLAQMT
ncbi:MAG TPA: sulfotransferase [Streptosporangiaceae bacterium]|nr:sulfotransferase [Streptosporangiaceae bacterium]